MKDLIEASIDCLMTDNPFLTSQPCEYLCKETPSHNAQVQKALKWEAVCVLEEQNRGPVRLTFSELSEK